MESQDKVIVIQGKQQVIEVTDFTAFQAQEEREFMTKLLENSEEVLDLSDL